MANFEGITACSGAKMKKEVKKYLEKFNISGEDIHVGLDDKGHFMFYGYCWPNIYEASDKDMEQDVSEEFFRGLKKFIKNDVLVIEMIGHEKCRFPMAAQQIIIKKDSVKFVTF